MAELKNEFAWSKTRNNVLNECLRKYWYSYYGDWGGWEKDAPKETREIYVLGKLQNRFIWHGDIVHRDGRKGIELF